MDSSEERSTPPVRVNRNGMMFVKLEDVANNDEAMDRMLESADAVERILQKQRDQGGQSYNTPSANGKHANGKRANGKRV